MKYTTFCPLTVQGTTQTEKNITSVLLSVKACEITLLKGMLQKTNGW